MDERRMVGSTVGIGHASLFDWPRKKSDNHGDCATPSHNVEGSSAF